MAVKIGKLCGKWSGALESNLQRAYDLWHAQRRVDVVANSDPAGG